MLPLLLELAAHPFLRLPSYLLTLHPLTTETFFLRFFNYLNVSYKYPPGEGGGETNGDTSTLGPKGVAGEPNKAAWISFPILSLF